MTKVRLAGGGAGACLAYDQALDTIHCYEGAVPPQGSRRLLELPGRVDLYALRLLITQWLNEHRGLSPKGDYRAFQQALSGFVMATAEAGSLVKADDGRALSVFVPDPPQGETVMEGLSSTPPVAKTITAFGAAATMVIAQLAEIGASAMATLALLEGKVGPELWAAVVLGSVVGPAVGKARGKLGGPTTLMLVGLLGKGVLAETIRRSMF